MQINNQGDIRIKDWVNMKIYKIYSIRKIIL